MNEKTADDHTRSVIEQRLSDAAEAEHQEAIRTFTSGATRDTAEGKLSYVEALAPIVLRRYLQYLNKHRLQTDGRMRDFDNWKKGIDKDTYLDSTGRHFVSLWLIHQGFQASDNHGKVDIEDALCAIIFNTMGYLFELLKDKKECLENAPPA